MESIADISDFIVQTCLKSRVPENLGTALASAVKAQFPSTDMKSKYGGLGAFIKRYCPEQVVFHGRSGLDLVYVHSSRLREVSGTAPVGSTSKATPWIAFTNPSVPDKLFVNQDSGELLAVSPDESPPERFVEVPKITEEDYRGIANDFISAFPESERVELSDLIAKPGFWFPFAKLIKQKMGGEGNERLRKSRLTKLHQLLAERLRAISELPKEAVEKACTAIRRRADQIPSSAISDRSISRRPLGRQLAIPADSVSTRRLAVAAIEAMRDDELRRVWLPLGVIVDAIRKLR
jgi:hypothetical protein